MSGPYDARALQSYAAVLPESGPGTGELVFLTLEADIDLILAAVDNGWLRIRLDEREGGEASGSIVVGSGAFELSDGDSRYAWAGVLALDDE